MKRVLSFNPLYFGVAALAFILAIRLIQPYWPTISAQTDQSELAKKISRTLERRAPLFPEAQEIITGSTQEPKKTPAAPKKDEGSSEPAKADAGSGEAAKTDHKAEAAISGGTAKAGGGGEGAAGEMISVPETITGEKTLLERLAARRQHIEEKEKSLSEREALLAAAEQRLEQRIAELKAADGELKATLEAKKSEQVSIKPLVTMYETMKPKDAARIFEKLQLADLLPIAQAMNPRKLSEILAQLDPAIAGKLTMGMAPVATPRNTAQVTNALPELPDLPALSR